MAASGGANLNILRRISTRAAMALTALLLASCAEPSPGPRHFEGPPRGRGSRSEGEGPPQRGALFISPAGKPFRSQPGEPYPVAAWFAHADRNADGRLDRDEFRADAAAFFQELDQDRDGIISSWEISRYEHQLVPEILGFGPGAAAEPQGRLILAQFEGGGPGGGMGGGGGGRGGKGGRRGGRGGGGGAAGGPPGGFGGAGGAAPYGLLGEQEPVTSADTDLNSQITRKEFEAVADRRFRLLDSMDVGYLTLVTLPKTPVQQTGGGRRRRRS